MSGETTRNGEEKTAKTMPGVVERIIKPVLPGDSEKAQISVEGADDLYKEIRIENTFETTDGKTVGLKAGAEVDVTIAAEAKDIVEKSGEVPTDRGPRKK